MSVTISFTGVENVQANLKKIQDGNKIARGATYKTGQQIMDHTKAKYVPVSQIRPRFYSGYLKDSGQVNQARTNQHGTFVKLFFTAWYAVYVHERTELRHPVGTSKFLEKGIIDAEQGGWFEKNVADVVGRNLQ